MIPEAAEVRFSPEDRSVRNGTSTLFAAFEVATGKVMATHKNRRRRVEFLNFMNSIVAAYPDTDIHVILDNLNTHKPRNDRGSSVTLTCSSTSRQREPRGLTRWRSGSRSCKASLCTVRPSTPSPSFASTSMPSSRPTMRMPNPSSGPKQRSTNAASKVAVSANCDSGYWRPLRFPRRRTVVPAREPSVISALLT